MRLRGALLALYVALTLVASTGVALQMYLMRVQNPTLGADMCRARGRRRPDHSLFCGLQMAPACRPWPSPPPQGP
jgi:hypothetical protein